MIESLVHILAGGAKGTQLDRPPLDIIVSITDDVPSSVSLDEAYTFSVSTLQRCLYISPCADWPKVLMNVRYNIPNPITLLHLPPTVTV